MDTEQRRQLREMLKLMERDLLRAGELLTEPEGATPGLMLRPWASVLHHNCRFKLPAELELIEPEHWTIQLSGRGANSVLRMQVQAGLEPAAPEPIEPKSKTAIQRAAARLWDVADLMSAVPEHETFRHQISFLNELSFSIHEYSESHRLAPFRFPTPKFWKATMHEPNESLMAREFKYTTPRMIIYAAI